MQKVTSKGQIVIPVALRRKYGIRRGNRVRVHESNGHIVVQPLTPEYVQAKLDRLCGALKGLPLVQDLAEERARERERENASLTAGLR